MDGKAIVSTTQYPMELRKAMIEKEHGFALDVHRGQILRVTAIAGAQTCDFNAFVAPGFREHFSAGRTRHFAGANPTVGDELWSNPPHDRTLFKIVEDTLGENDTLFPRCSRIIYDKAGLPNHRNCQDNLAEAIAPYGLGADDVHDTFNIFMNTHAEPSGRIRIDPPSTRVGEHLDLLCEVDCMVALSACPDGDKYGRENLPLLVQLFATGSPD
jgi:uncharacterized protein YcgI (DUF1989 family)